MTAKFPAQKCWSAELFQNTPVFQMKIPRIKKNHIYRNIPISYDDELIRIVIQ